MSPRKLAEYSVVLTAASLAGDLAAALVDMRTGPMHTFAVQAKATGFTAWSLLLQGSLDGVNWVTLLAHTQATPGDGAIVWTTAKLPVKKVRLNLTSVTGSGSLACAMLGVSN